MRHLFSVPALGVAVALSLPAQAGGIHQNSLHHCSMTPSLATIHAPKPKQVPTSNALIQPAGKPLPAAGQPLVISGRVYGSNCTPLVGAQVEIWQADAFGHISFPKREAFATPDPLFAGSGLSISDNLGNYGFYTIFPAPESPAKAPRVYFRITHPSLPKPYTTAMLFGGDARNIKDAEFTALSSENKYLIAADIAQENPDSLQAYFDLTLAGEEPFLHN